MFPACVGRIDHGALAPFSFPSRRFSPIRTRPLDSLAGTSTDLAGRHPGLRHQLL